MIPAMRQPPESILRCDRKKCSPYRLLEGLRSPCSHAAYKGFQLGECFFNRRKIGGVGWEKQELVSPCFDGLPNLFSGMHTHIIHDHDVPYLQTRCQKPFNISFKSGGIRFLLFTRASCLFLSCPVQELDRTAHCCWTHLNALLGFPKFAMFGKCCIRIRFELREESSL